MRGLVSICIPTYNRPELLRQALDSCIAQTYPEYEIVIGDDSKSEASELLAGEYSERYPGKIRYQQNRPPLGQAANVNSLFCRASGERLVLLHDDDLLLPDSLEQLSACWDRLPTLIAAFGKQYLIDHDGNVLPTSDAANAHWQRIAENAGRQQVPAVAGLLRMFPNDGYMTLTKIARKIRYRSRAEVGDACDADFGLRLCLAADDIWFLNEYTSKYRHSNDAISRRSQPQPFTYDLMRSMPVPAAAMTARRTALEGLAPAATSGFARLDRPSKALSVFISPNYTLRDKLRLRALYHIFLIVAAYIRAGARKCPSRLSARR